MVPPARPRCQRVRPPSGAPAFFKRPAVRSPHDGRGHIVRNESGAPATDVSVILAPETQSFRGELDAPGPHCAF
jgi:hypothetical protein